MPRRALSQLFDRAARARTDDDLAEAAVGADGYGFVLLDALETRRVYVGGRKLASLPGSIDTGLAAHVVGLTGGRVEITGHVEELFTLTLCVVSPRGGQRLVSFYHGASGNSLGGSPDELDDASAEVVAVSWERALRKAPAIDFQVHVDSDFGKFWMIVRGGTASQARKAASGIAPLAPVASNTTAGLEAALTRTAAPGGSPCERFDDLYSAHEETAEAAAAALEPAVFARLDDLWLPAVDELTGALAAVVAGTGPALTPAMERLTTVLPAPERVAMPHARSAQLWDYHRQLAERRRARPW